MNKKELTEKEMEMVSGETRQGISIRLDKQIGLVGAGAGEAGEHGLAEVVLACEFRHDDLPCNTSLKGKKSQCATCPKNN